MNTVFYREVTSYKILQRCATFLEKIVFLFQQLKAILLPRIGLDKWLSSSLVPVRISLGLIYVAAQLVGLFHQVCYEQRVYQERNQNTNELRQRLVTAWKDLGQHVIDTAIDQWRRRLVQNSDILYTTCRLKQLTYGGSYAPK